MTETNPVASLRVKAAIGTYKASAIVVDSMQTNLSKLASHPIMVKPGTEGLLVKGLVKSVLDQDLVDLDVTSEAPQAFNALKQATDAISLDEVAKQTGISAKQINDIAKIFAEAPVLLFFVERESFGRRMVIIMS